MSDENVNDVGLVQVLHIGYTVKLLPHILYAAGRFPSNCNFY